ncbi:hypothetical protein CN918_25265 [Priestia megaterium]|nr:hypothetical protein CN918_25265 [Priestia megaterium]
MQFVVNGVIRSLTLKERTNELKQLLLGKVLKVNEVICFEVTDILLRSHVILFCGLSDSYEIPKVKKIEIELLENRIRITSVSTQYIIPLI